MKQKRLEPYFFLLPAVLLVLFIYLIPFIFSIVISLTNWNGISRDFDFIGIRNYLEIFQTKELQDVLKNNLIYFIEIVIIQNVLGIFFAVLLQDQFRGRNFFRAVLFLPSVICTVAIGFIWNLMLDPVSGLLPGVLSALGLDRLSKVLWLADSHVAIHTISLVNVWQWLGQSMVIYLAGILSIDKSLYEAGAIDGVGRSQKFWKITLPLMAPSLTINIVLSTIGTLKIYDLPFIMTGGGPGHATESLAINVYSSAFVYSRMGYGTAVSLTLFVFVLIVSLIQMKIMRGREDAVL
ncbi:MAG TPA: sugar ABC transporter permease [Candidatus Limiplasma sp.]|nr:sugar ABC transporter permease [Candidatus Limiplasma sp.]HPR77103.1 sugar ABC transporter permease [Candidatus Limiplasma sp.]